MSEVFENLMKNIEQLSTKEKALAAQSLLSAMDSHSNDVEQDWIALAEQRSSELELGEVKPISWAQIKQIFVY